MHYAFFNLTNTQKNFDEFIFKKNMKINMAKMTAKKMIVCKG
jgi:hypothetical protein